MRLPRCCRALGMALVFALAGSGLLVVDTGAEPEPELARLLRKRWGQEHGMPHGTVYRLLEDRRGFLWIGTREGLARFDGVSLVTYGRAELKLARSSRVQALAEDQEGRLWVGTDGGELLRYQGGTFRRFGPEDGLEVGRITELVPAPGDELYIATYADGVFRFAGGRFERVVDPEQTGGAASPISKLILEREGGMLIATIGGGLHHFANDRWRNYTTADGLPSNRIWAVAKARSGGWWVATQAGLCRFQNERCRTYTTADGLRSHHTTSLFEDAAGSLYIGTYGGGLHRLQVDGRIENLPTEVDGARDIVWHVYADRGGAIWTANVDQGLRLFAPALPSPVSETPTPLIEELLVDGRAISLERTPHLSPESRVYAWRFAAPLAHAGAKVKLRYRLLGVDENWVEANSERVATYSGLAPREYRFEVQASNTAGTFEKPPAASDLVVEAGFGHLRLPLLILFGLSLVAWAFHHWRVRQMAAREKELAERIGRAMADIQVLQALLPLCGHCHKVRDDQGYWQQVEIYVSERSDVEFTHGMCPDCARRFIAELEDSRQGAA